MLDISDMYGFDHNEELVGRALAGHHEFPLSRTAHEKRIPLTVEVAGELSCERRA
jgi:hypothetical protein